MSTEESRATVEAMYAAGMAGDVRRLLACLHEDLVLHEPPQLPWGGVYHGPAGFQELFARASPYIDVAGATIESVIADGDRVASVMHVPIFGSNVRATVAETWTVWDRQIVLGRVYWFDVGLLPGRAVAAD